MEADRDMEIGVPTVPSKLVEAGARDQLLIVVGAGASRAADLPSWNELVNVLAEQARKEGKIDRQLFEEIRDAVSKGDPITGVSMLDEGWARARVVKIFGDPALRPTATHRALARISGALFVTTNYDRLLEIAIEEVAGAAPSVCTMSQTSAIARMKPGDVLKLHGDVDHPDDLVLDLSDYRNVRGCPEAWRKTLESYLSRGEVLLVGYGYSDQHLRSTVEDVLNAFRGARPGPFWLEKRSRLVETKAEGLELRLSPVADYPEIPTFLEKLGEAIRRRRDLLSGAILARTVSADLPRNLEVAAEHFQAGRFDKALDLYGRALDYARALPSDELETSRSLIARCQLNVAASLLCLQRSDEGRDAVLEVDPDALDAGARGVLVQALIQVGELERAEEVMPATPARSVEAARQLLAISRGELPEDVLDDLFVRHRAAQLAIERGRAGYASRLLVASLEADDLVAPWRLATLSILFRTLHATVMEWPPQHEPIPLSERARVLELLEQGLPRLEREELPPTFEEPLLWTRAGFAWLTRDPVLLELEARLASRGLATAGVESESRELRAGHPWFARLAAVAEMTAGDPRARAAALDLASAWPGRAHIELLAAQVLLAEGDVASAVPHALSAFDALPAKTFRRVAGSALARAGSHAEAWALLEPLRGSDDIEVLQARAVASTAATPAIRWSVGGATRKRAAGPMPGSFLRRSLHATAMSGRRPDRR